MNPRSIRLLLLLALAAASPVAHAEVTDIAWNAKNRFEHSATVPAGKFVELCGKLSQGQTVQWSFDSDQRTDFNIHYHQGKQVVFPVKRNGVAKLEGTLQVLLDQDYCWMWTNKTTAPAALSVRLQR